eukprot:gene12172-biopygen19932
MKGNDENAAPQALRSTAAGAVEDNKYKDREAGKAKEAHPSRRLQGQHCADGAGRGRVAMPQQTLSAILQRAALRAPLADTPPPPPRGKRVWGKPHRIYKKWARRSRERVYKKTSQPGGAGPRFFRLFTVLATALRWVALGWRNSAQPTTTQCNPAQPSAAQRTPERQRSHRRALQRQRSTATATAMVNGNGNGNGQRQR